MTRTLSGGGKTSIMAINKTDIQNRLINNYINVYSIPYLLIIAHVIIAFISGGL